MKKTLIIALIALMTVGIVAATGDRYDCPEGSYYAGYESVVWANSVVSTSGSVSNANRAIGPEDNSWAEISATNPDSFIVLDMGEGEEIWDNEYGNPDFDLKLYGDNSDETAYIYVSNSPNSGWDFAGSVNSDETAQVEIDGTIYNNQYIRYVAIVNPNPSKKVEVDAVRGFCITEPSNDVPEFGVIGGAIAALGAIGILIFRKK